jgi:hypothetical protein
VAHRTGFCRHSTGNTKSDRAEGLDTESRKERSTVFKGPLPISSIFCAKPGSLALRIGVISLIVLKRGHKGDDFTEASIASDLEPLGMTGHVWRKSPSKTMTFPLKGSSFNITFWSASLTQDRTALLAMGASSHIISDAILSSLAHVSVQCIGNSRSSELSFTGIYAVD